MPLRRDYGPWPEQCSDAARLRRRAAAVGLEPDGAADWTAATLPSYRTIAPSDQPELRPDPDAGAVLRWMHTRGWLSYQVLRFRRQAR